MLTPPDSIVPILQPFSTAQSSLTFNSAGFCYYSWSDILDKVMSRWCSA